MLFFYHFPSCLLTFPYSFYDLTPHLVRRSIRKESAAVEFSDLLLTWAKPFSLSIWMVLLSTCLVIGALNRVIEGHGHSPIVYINVNIEVHGHCRCPRGRAQSRALKEGVLYFRYNKCKKADEFSKIFNIVKVNSDNVH